MSDLIKALQILLKYGDPKYPTVCEHDVLYIVDIHPETVTKSDKAKLARLGFNITDEFGDKQFYSFKFGSA